MSFLSTSARRATVDDLPALRQLWSSARLSTPELERRLTEFQVVQDVEGRLLACIGLHITGQHGNIHTEVYRDPATRSELQPMLWARILNLSRNHGLARVWVRAADAFWGEVGFAASSAEAPDELAGADSNADRGLPWRVFILRESASASDIERELALLRQVQEAQTTRILRHVRVLRVIAAIMAFITLVLIILAFWAISRRW